MSALTKKQTEILAYIRSYLADNGYAPSYREIADHFGLSSPATVHQHVKTLTEKGVIAIGDEGEARSIELVQEMPMDRFAVVLPLSGLITAGSPIEAVEERETFAVPTQFVV